MYSTLKVFTKNIPKFTLSRGAMEQKYMKIFIRQGTPVSPLTSIIMPGLRQERVCIIIFPVASRRLNLARIKYASLQGM